MSKLGIAVIAGAGEGLGFGIARRFAAAGHTVALVARKADRLGRMAAEIEATGGRTVAVPADIRREDEVSRLFEHIEAAHGPIEVAVYNPGAQFRAPLLDTPAEMFEKVWRLSCYGGFLFGRDAARVMLSRGRGTILFMGAAASLRGGAEFAAFASAKSGPRMIAQSMAREFGVQGLHVAHVVVDGMIDTAAVRARFPEAVADVPEEGLLAPDAIGEVYVQIHRQARSAWTFEVDMRPWSERF